MKKGFQMRTLEQYFTTGCSILLLYGFKSDIIMSFIKLWTYIIKSWNLTLSDNHQADRYPFDCDFGMKTSKLSLPFDWCMGRRAPTRSSCSVCNLLEMEHSIPWFPCGKLFLKSCQTKHSSTVLGSTLKSHVSLYLNHRLIFWKHLQADFCFTFIAGFRCNNSCLILNSLMV